MSMENTEQGQGERRLPAENAEYENRRNANSLSFSQLEFSRKKDRQWLMLMSIRKTSMIKSERREALASAQRARGGKRDRREIQNSRHAGSTNKTLYFEE